MVVALTGIAQRPFVQPWHPAAAHTTGAGVNLGSSWTVFRLMSWNPNHFPGPALHPLFWARKTEVCVYLCIIDFHHGSVFLDNSCYTSYAKGLVYIDTLQ